MPLESGSSQESIHNNIKKLLVEKMPRKQAIAIALQKAGKKKKMDCGVVLNTGLNSPQENPA